MMDFNFVVRAFLSNQLLEGWIVCGEDWQLGHQNPLTTAGLRCGSPRQADNLAPFQIVILKNCFQHLFSGGGEKLVFY
jgi:hypothetical protein